MATQRPSGTREPTTAEIDAHHSLPTHELVLLLESDVATGLSSSEVDDRLRRFGPNVLPEGQGRGPLVRFASQFHHPLIYVLLAASAITLALGEHVDSAVIFAVVMVNAIVGYIQESKAEAALDALRSLVRTEARVRRDGEQQMVPSEGLVPGDIAFIEAGDKVPADLRLVDLVELKVDESMLTGESLPVAKDQVILPASTAVADRQNMVYSATLVTHGTGVGLVVATGSGTELGEIHRLVGIAENLATPLTKKLAWFSKVLTAAILALASLTFAVGVLRGEDIADMFTAAVALAVGAIPEGLPAAVTITLAIGVNRMARRRAVIRRMPAVETLGSTTVICSDKTGTLTENQMTVRRIWTSEASFVVTGTGYETNGAVLDENGSSTALFEEDALRWTLRIGASCNDARLDVRDGDAIVIGDPTEGAMLVAASKTSVGRDVPTDALPRIGAIPFNSDRKYMATLHGDGDGDGDGSRLVLAKGAVERVLELCGTQMLADGSTTDLDARRVLDAVDELAGEGLRVLATAMARVDASAPFTPDGLRGTLTLTGMQAMQDPPRPEAVEAVRTCHDAGIDVKMITGDHAATAAAVARQIGILGGDEERRVLTGVELAELDAGDYPDAVEYASVFARVSPEQKLRLVEALQSRGHVVAMTGDGVNDAPALQQADIGISMGKGGTEVAKEASDMVLTDDDFSTIEAAVEEGRGVFDNLTKFIVWTLPTNMGEGLVILVAILLGATLPLVPVQILWINMTTAVALGLMLAFEPKEDDIMQRPPRDPRASLLSGSLLIRIALVSALLVSGAWWLFEWEQANGATLAEARTAALNVFVVVEAFYLFSCRSLTHSVRHIGWFTNRFILVGVTAQALGQVAITYLPFMNTAFGTAPLGAGAWLRIFAIAVAATAVVTVDKRLRRHFA